jgi:hypothetical protein
MVERNAARSSAWRALHLCLIFSGVLDATPHITSQPTMQIFKRIFGDAIARAIDFAEAADAMRSWRRGGLCTKPNF